jgi:DNA-directed RNA polymerase subunit beta'
VLTTDPNKQFEELKTRLLAEIHSTFPIVDQKTGIEVRVRNLEVGGADLGTDDIQGQMNARLGGRSYTAPVFGHVDVVDRDGKVLVSKRARIADIPRLTRHHSFIIGGQEKTIANQWRLRPGAYVKATEKKGEYEAQFQLAKGKSFDVQMEPGTGYMFIKSGARKIPLYSVLKATGVSDDQMKQAWGDRNFTANQKKSRYDQDLKSFYTAMKDAHQVPSAAELPQAIKGYLAETRMDPAVTKTTLGHGFESVSGDALLRASAKIVDVSAERTRPDPIDSLEFKELWTPTDHFAERLRASKHEIHSRVLKSLGKKSTLESLRAGHASALRDIMMPDLVQKPINHVFATSLASNSKQTNPVAMLADHSLTTIMGPGGLKSEHQVTLSNTSVDPSHLGFLDPVFTPEGGGAGTSLHLTNGITVKNRKPYAKLYNIKKGKVEELTPAEAARAVVVLPDQIKWEQGKPKPISPTVRVSNKDGEIEELPFSRAEYTLITPGQVFSTETNLVPFMQNDAAGRTTMSARHMAQALSVVGREPPKVQVEAAPGVSFEQRIGQTFLSHKAPIDGRVTAVSASEITLVDKDGRERKVHLYDHYPLNDKKAMLHSTPKVKVGDQVRAGQALADNSFTRDGTLALGTNVRVAYLASGWNHEDGVVLSQSAASKLGTEHLLKPSFYATGNHVISKKSFLNDKANAYSQAQLTNIGDDGLIKPGTRVQPGDPLVLALREQKDPDSIDSKMLAQLTKKGRVGYSNAAMTWDHPYPGEVVRVVRNGKNIVVHVKTAEPLVVGSKVSTRHSAKGIVTQVVPDHEMPFSEKGGKKEHVEMLINPVSVPGRMNPGQILETAAGKIAEKTGKPYIVKNFDGQTDYLKKVQDELKKHGLKETETLVDPKTGRKLGDITVGPHYVFQLEHQVDKKTHVRHGGFYLKDHAPMIQYDTNLVPRGGDASGAQSLGSLGVYGALAAGLRQNLGEMTTLKSDRPQAEALWEALANGKSLPPPQVPFVYQKFEALLHGAGLNTEKRGNQIQIMPLTDKEVLARAGKHARVTDPSATVMAKNMKPESGGLFDTRIFGADKQNWGYIELAEPMPNPVFAKTVVNLLNIKGGDAKRANEGQLIQKVIAGELTVHGKSGGQAIRDALAKIDIDKEMKKLRTQMDDPKVKGADLNRVTSTYKALATLKEQGKTPMEAYTLKYMPVIPPIYRPFQENTDGGQDRIDPLNQLYRRLGMVNTSLEKSKAEGIPHKRLLKTQADLFQEMQNLIGTTPKGKKALDIDFQGKEVKGRHLPGILHTIAGESPKDGFFQNRVISKKQDYTARATIVADPGLGADEVGVPKKIAFELFRPLVAHRLTQMGMNPFEAQKEISNRTPTAEAMLQKEIESRPVLMKRDPVLHQYGIIGQKVKLTDSQAVKVSPLVLPPIGGDIDGDAVALMLPISHEAVQEVNKLLPSNRSMSASTGEALFSPTNEALLALYRMSLPKKQTSHSFSTKEEAEKAFLDNKINLDDVVTVGGKRTTLGRARIAQMVPTKYRDKILTDLQAPVTKKFVSELLRDVARNEPAHFGSLTQNITQLGFKMAYESGHTVRLSDLEPHRAERAKVVAQARQLATKAKTDDERTKIWMDATRNLHKIYGEKHKENPTNVSDMAHSGIKAKREQFQGLVIAPMLVEDHLGRPSKIPVTRSFAEGVDIGGYFLQSSGARRGVIQKTDAVRDPGTLTKELIQANIDSPITSHDCGTPQGISLGANDRDLVDRYLASPVTVSGKTLPAGTVITPELQSSLSRNGITNVFVRSPLKCRMPQGICSVCMGKHPSGSNYTLGDNVGVIAAQAIGERAAQLMLKQTHNQGIVPISRGAVDEFDTVKSLFGVAKKSPAKDAIVAPKAGKVTRVEPQPQGGFKVYYDSSKVPLYSRHALKPEIRVGHTFQRGDQLTEGDPNMRDLLKTRGIEAAQDFMVNRIGKIYEKEDVLRRHVELTVRNATSTVEVVNPGDHPSILRGDHLQKAMVDEVNRTTLKGKRPIQVKPFLEATQTTTARRQGDWMARLMTNNLQQHVVTAATMGEKSDIHGLHPIPGLAYGREFGQGRGPARY